MHRIDAERVLVKSSSRRARPAARILVEGDRLLGLEQSPGLQNGLLALPALANAHDHARAVKPAALGALELPLELWLAAITGSPRIDPYLVGAVAFGRSALGGQASVMVHYIRWQGGMSQVEEAREIARAAHDVGVRIGFAPTMRDRNWIAYADDEKTLASFAAADRDRIREKLVGPAVPPREQVAIVEEIARAVESPLVTVQFGPAAVQWCSDALLEAIAERSAATGRRVHMHLLETRFQREWADRHYPGGIVRHLDAIGLLSPRLSLAHCTWCRPDELALLAECGVTVSVNNSSNLGIRSGVAPVREMLKAGVRIAAGLDGVGIDDDDDALRELRLGWFLHQGTGLEPGLDAATLFHAAASNGRRAVTGLEDEATLAPGAPADLMLLDYASLSRDVIRDDLEELPLVLARGTRSSLRGLFVAGREVVKDGRLTGIDLPRLEDELLAQLRKGQADFNDWQRTVLRMRASLTAFYASGMHCT